MILIIALSFFTLLSLEPVILGLTILGMALSLSVTQFYLRSEWVGIILFLVFIRGILVLFAYFCALSIRKPLIRRLWLAGALFLSGLINFFSLGRDSSIARELVVLSIVQIPYIFIFLGTFLLLVLLVVVRVCFRGGHSSLRFFKTEV